MTFKLQPYLILSYLQLKSYSLHPGSTDNRLLLPRIALWKTVSASRGSPGHSDEKDNSCLQGACTLGRRDGIANDFLTVWWVLPSHKHSGSSEHQVGAHSPSGGSQERLPGCNTWAERMDPTPFGLAWTLPTCSDSKSCLRSIAQTKSRPQSWALLSFSPKTNWYSLSSPEVPFWPALLPSSLEAGTKPVFPGISRVPCLHQAFGTKSGLRTYFREDWYLRQDRTGSNSMWVNQ